MGLRNKILTMYEIWYDSTESLQDSGFEKKKKKKTENKSYAKTSQSRQKNSPQLSLFSDSPPKKKQTRPNYAKKP